MADLLYSNKTEEQKQIKLQNENLIRGFVLMEQDHIRPSKKSDGLLEMDGIFQRVNSPNANGRIYPEKVLRREVEKYMDLCSERRSLGELDHPESAVVQLENVSHVVTNLNWDGDTLKGTLEVLTTPKGEILASLVENNIKLGISSRGLGSTSRTSEGYDLVQEDFNLICFDAVSNPSTNQAFLNSRIQESVKSFINNEKLLKESQEYKSLLESTRWITLDQMLDEILNLEN